MGRDQVGRVRSTWSGNEHSLGSMDLGLPEPVPCINRSRYTTVEPAYLKAVTSRPDRIIDIEGDFNRSMNEDAMIALRAEHRPTEGLLLLYPVSKDSVPVRTGRDPDPRRRDLDAEEHILALALVFPPSQIEDAEYISNDLSAVFGGSADFDLDDEFDAPEPDEGEELEG